MSPGRIVEDIENMRIFISGFVNSFPGAVIALDNLWRIVYMNEKAEKYFDKSTASLIGAQLKDAYPKQLDMILNPEVIKNTMKSKEASDVKYSNSLHRWFRISVHGSDRFIFIQFVDITAEELLNRLLRLNEYSVSIAKDMVFWLKPGGHIIYSNTALQISLGYKNHDIAKMKIFDIAPSMTAGTWFELIESLELDKARTFETTFQAASGHSIPVEVTWNYLKYRGEAYIMAFARDISTRKKAEKQIMTSKAEAELYVDLMGHDINNMNQVALGYLELALDEIKAGGKIDSKHIEMIEKPREMLLSSSKLIDNVRKIRREKAGSYETRTMNIGDILLEVKDQNSKVPGRDIKIELVQNGQCRVEANELLKDVFTNLVGNSIKHSKGPLEIKITIGREKEDGISYCRVAVEDDGPGIPDDVKEKLLNRLGSDTPRVRGKGLGLYLIKQLVDDFNGRFWMEDRVPGDHTQGARFVVMLPSGEE